MIPTLEKLRGPLFTAALCFVSLGYCDAPAQTGFRKPLFTDFPNQPLVFASATPHHLPYALSTVTDTDHNIKTTAIYGNVLEGRVQGKPVAIRYEGYGISYRLPVRFGGSYSGSFVLDADRYDFNSAYGDHGRSEHYTLATNRHRIAIHHTAALGFLEAGVSAGIRSTGEKEDFEYGASAGINLFESRLGVAYRADALNQSSTVRFNEDEVLLPLSLQNRSAIFYLETDYFGDLSIRSYLRYDRAHAINPAAGSFSGTPQSRQTGFGVVAIYQRPSYTISSLIVLGSPSGISRFYKYDQQYAKLNVPEFDYRQFDVEGLINVTARTSFNSGFSYQAVNTHVGVIAEGWPFASLVDLLGTRYNADLDARGTISMVSAGVSQKIGSRHAVSARAMHLNLTLNADYSHRKSEGLFGFSGFYERNVDTSIPIAYFGLGYRFSVKRFEATAEAGQLTRSVFDSGRTSGIFGGFHVTGGGTFARLEFKFMI